MKILVTAAGAPGFLTLYKSISKYDSNIEIFICDSNPNSYNLSLFKNSFLVSKASSSEYIREILDICKSKFIDILIPSSDEEIQEIGKSFEEFQKIGTKILCNTSNLEVVFHKSKFYEKIESKFPKLVPEYEHVTNLEEFISAFDRLSKKHDLLCVKPAVAHGSRGFRIIKEPDLTRFFLEKVNPYEISYKSLTDVLSQQEKFPDLLLMEYLPGDEYSVDCLMLNSGFLSVSRRRDTIKEGICSSGEAIKKDDLIQISRDLYNFFEIKFNANFQYRYDSEGNPKIIELNPRFSGTMELCRGAGVDFAKLALDKLLDVPCKSLPEIKWGTKMQRVWEEVFSCNGETFVLESVGSILEKKHV